MTPRTPFPVGRRAPWPSLRTLVLLGAALVVGAGAWGGASLWFGRQAGIAAALYADAVAPLGSADPAEAPSGARAAAVGRLEMLLEQYPSAPVTAEAAYQLGNLRYVDRDWAGARAAYEIALARTASPTLEAMARLGLAYALEAEGDHAKAIETYRAALAGRLADSFAWEQLMAGLGRAQELAGQKDEAIETYQRLLEAAPQNQLADDVRRRLVTLGVAPKQPAR